MISIKTVVILGAVFLIPAIASGTEPGEVSCPHGSRKVVREQGRVFGCERGPAHKAVRVGQWTWLNDDRKVVFSVTYDDQGREHGKATRYGATGQVLQEQTFVDGRLEGQELTRWPSGHLRTESEYRNGKLHGLRKRWDYDRQRQKGCTPEKESCWFGSQECWVEGERRPHEACFGIYAEREQRAKTGRAPASVSTGRVVAGSSR